MFGHLALIEGHGDLDMRKRRSGVDAYVSLAMHIGHIERDYMFTVNVLISSLIYAVYFGVYSPQSSAMLFDNVQPQRQRYVKVHENATNAL